MKKLITILAVAFAVTGYSQTNATIDSFGHQVADILFGPGLTNLSLTGGATYSTGNKEWGEFALLTRNVPLGGGVGLGISAGVDHYAHAFYAVSGQVSLQVALTPFSSLITNTTGPLGVLHNMTATPIGFLGVGTPFGGGSQSSSSPETIQGTGGFLSIPLGKGFYLNPLGLYGTRQGIGSASGAFVGGGLTLSKLF